MSGVHVQLACVAGARKGKGDKGNRARGGKEKVATFSFSPRVREKCLNSERYNAIW